MPTVDFHTTDRQDHQRSARVPKLALTIVEAGQALGLSPRTIEELVRMDQLPIVRVGRRVLLPVVGLRRWLERSTQNSEGR